MEQSDEELMAKAVLDHLADFCLQADIVAVRFDRCLSGLIYLGYDIIKVGRSVRVKRLGEQLLELDVNPAVSRRLKIGDVVGDCLLSETLGLYAGLQEINDAAYL